MPDKIFSLSKAIREMLDGGKLTGHERECHYMVARDMESTPHKWMHSDNARDQALQVPIELFTSPTNYFGISDRNRNLWCVELTNVERLRARWRNVFDRA